MSNSLFIMSSSEQNIGLLVLGFLCLGYLMMELVRPAMRLLDTRSSFHRDWEVASSEVVRVGSVMVLMDRGARTKGPQIGISGGWDLSDA